MYTINLFKEEIFLKIPHSQTKNSCIFFDNLYEEVEAWELNPSFELLSDDDYIKSK